MKLRKALEIVNCYAHEILKDKPNGMNELTLEEQEELKEAHDTISNFIKEFD